MKQVIVIRKDLNMRKGKMIAQGSHASLSAYKKALKSNKSNVTKWENEGQKKIVVGVEDEASLLQVQVKAKIANLPFALIKDAGLTEFKEPTFTAIAVGPAKAEDIDLITGKLTLL